MISFTLPSLFPEEGPQHYPWTVAGLDTVEKRKILPSWQPGSSSSHSSHCTDWSKRDSGRIFVSVWCYLCKVHQICQQLYISSELYNASGLTKDSRFRGMARFRQEGVLEGEQRGEMGSFRLNCNISLL